MSGSGPGRFARWALQVLAVAVAAGIGLGLGALTGGGDRPVPVILVLVDTLRADYLGYSGFEGEISPNIDALARESVRFSTCVSQAPWTKPSVASLLTSLYPESHGITNHQGAYWGGESAELRAGILPDEAVTLAEVLHGEGYRTAAFVANPWLVQGYGFSQGFEVYDDHAASDTTRAGTVLEGARRWLRGLEKDARFFLYLHFMDVHGPYLGPEADAEAILDSPSLGPPHALTGAEAGAIPEYLRNVPWRGPDEARRRRAWRARYGAGIRAFDRALGGFIEELRDSGVLNRSVVVVTSDHGEELGDHGGWDHGFNLYDHQVHVPLLVRLPHAINGGRVVDGVVSLIDVMPTVLGLAGVEPPPGFQGHDVSMLWRRDADQGNRPSFSTATKNRPGLYSVRTRTHKLVVDVSRRGSARLYDLAADPEERHDVAADQPDTARALMNELNRHIGRMKERGHLQPASGAVSEEMRKRLKSLGYVR